jgi:hypothetical protein
LAVSVKILADLDRFRPRISEEKTFSYVTSVFICSWYARVDPSLVNTQ